MTVANACPIYFFSPSTSVGRGICLEPFSGAIYSDIFVFSTYWFWAKKYSSLVMLVKVHDDRNLFLFSTGHRVHWLSGTMIYKANLYLTYRYRHIIHEPLMMKVE